MAQCVVMFTFRLIILLLFSVIGLSAQSPIGAACAKAGLKAVETINSNPKSDAAKAAFEDTKAKCDHTKKNEYAALLEVTAVKMARERGPVPSSCVNPIEDAFRRNVVLDDPPESCVTGE
jgi:hypothetical protein